MESKDKVELIEQAIKQLMEEGDREMNKKSSDESLVAVDDDEDDRRRLLLSKLLSQLEILKAEGKLQLPELSADAEELLSPEVGKVDAKSEAANNEDGSSSGIGEEEIIRELRNVKKQNFITHCLLSVMIVLTVAWKLSEVSLILKVKDRVSHPFRSVGSMISGMLKVPNLNSQEGVKQSSTKPKLIESSSLPCLEIPELPHVELPAFN